MDAATPLTAAALAGRVLAASPRLGGTRLVCVDGPAGSGKTTLAAGLTEALSDAVTVHMDDLYTGWTLTGAAARLAAGVLRPLSEGRPGAYHRFDWGTGRFSPDATPVRPPEVLVVEGCGSASRRVDPWASLRVWVEAEPSVRLARGLARDGAHVAGEWRDWRRTEAAHFAADGTRSRADVLVDGGS
ncbi:uridine kinase family protein [Blastococcus capsensis]|uniref:uridine kinase family protein n=1 Tax=Blastococcus capsensis TaxID=1564163 RepID=UPI00253F9BC3|nr:uridine kinase [Blastococcus capsensis]MDK3258031.1 uridine kinase [Blastococcus capsensis]